MWSQRLLSFLSHLLFLHIYCIGPGWWTCSLLARQRSYKLSFLSQFPPTFCVYFAGVCVCVTPQHPILWPRRAPLRLPQARAGQMRPNSNRKIRETERFHWPCQGQHSSTGRCLAELLFHGLCKPPQRDGIHGSERMKAKENEFLKESGVQTRRAKVPNLVGNVSAHHITAVCS